MEDLYYAIGQYISHTVLKVDKLSLTQLKLSSESTIHCAIHTHIPIIRTHYYIHTHSHFWVHQRTCSYCTIATSTKMHTCNIHTAHQTPQTHTHTHTYLYARQHEKIRTVCVYKHGMSLQSQQLPYKELSSVHNRYWCPHNLTVKWINYFCYSWLLYKPEISSRSQQLYAHKIARHCTYQVVIEQACRLSDTQWKIAKFKA